MNTFPSDFVWGSATASYQVEGAVNEDGRSKSIWDTFSHTPGKIVNNDTGDVACDHYHRYKEDIALMKEMNLAAYRFSIAWPRVIPGGVGAVNEKGLDFYERVTDELLRVGIEPYVTLYHWDLPQVLQDRGGWTNRDIANWFTDYAEVVVKRLGDRIKYWTTFNEPEVISLVANLWGAHAPGNRDPKIATAVAHNVYRAHGTAMQALRAAVPQNEYGIVLNLWPFEAATDKPEDIAAAELGWQQNAGWFLDPLFRGTYPQLMLDYYGANGPDIQPGDMELMQQPLDFMGINFYHRDIVSAQGPVMRPELKYTAMDWEVYAPSLTELLVDLTRDYDLPPLYITENGAAFHDTVTNGQVNDTDRLNYVRDHVYATLAAIEKGVDVRGYFVWSLLDNFEWGWGYGMRFGVVHVDFETQKRTIKDSGKWYADFIRANSLQPA